MTGQHTIGPYVVTDGQFTMSDLRKIGPYTQADGSRIFIDYDGSDDEWYSYPIGPKTPRVEGQYHSDDRVASRRKTLKGMITRRANKARREARAAAAKAQA